MTAVTGAAARTPAALFGPTGPGERHAAYATLAATGPVHRVEPPDGTRAWLVTGDDAVRAALTDPRLTKHLGPVPGGGLLPPAFDAAINSVHHDPPDHTRLRRLVSAAFTRRRVDALAPRIQQIADALLGDLAGQPEADLVSAFVYPLPITVISELLGVPGIHIQLTHPDHLALLRTEPNGCPHLAFGHGVHHCLGAPLARLEGRIALGSLLARFPDLRLAVPAEDLLWRPSVLMHGLAALPVRLIPSPTRRT